MRKETRPLLQSLFMQPFPSRAPGIRGGFLEKFYVEKRRPRRIRRPVIHFDQTPRGRQIILEPGLIEEEPHLELRQQSRLGVRQQGSHIDLYEVPRVSSEEAQGSARPESGVEVAAYDGGRKEDRVDRIQQERDGSGGARDERDVVDEYGEARELDGSIRRERRQREDEEAAGFGDGHVRYRIDVDPGQDIHRIRRHGWRADEPGCQVLRDVSVQRRVAEDLHDGGGHRDRRTPLGPTPTEPPFPGNTVFSWPFHLPRVLPV